MRWTPEADALIEAGYKAGDRTKAIAERIGNGCTKNMVIGRARRLGLIHALPHGQPMLPREPRPPRERKPRKPRERKPAKPKRIIPSDPYERAAMYAALCGVRAFTADEDALISVMYSRYEPTLKIAETIGRVDKGKDPSGTVRQRIRQLGLHRAGYVFRALQWAPDHLRPLAFSDEAAFLKQAYAWRDEQAALAQAEKVRVKNERIANALAEINPAGMTRNQVICAKRAAGLTLQAIADEYSMTSERVRQIEKLGPDHVPQACGAEPRIDKAEVVRLAGRLMSHREIAERVGCSPASVANILWSHGIRGGKYQRRARLSDSEYTALMWEEAGAELAAKQASHA